MSQSREPIYAAGGVVWREIDGELRLIVVRRDRHRDISLPKGKLDEGELLPATAVRELEEETGLVVTLGPPLGTSVRKQPSGRDKIVQFWAAEAAKKAVEQSTFAPNDEIADVQWLTVPEARERLTYESDLTILDVFDRHRTAGTLRTFPLIVLRHAEAVGRNGWTSADAKRPPSPRGRSQARLIVDALRAYGVRRIVSSPAQRCMKTVAPLARALDCEVREAPGISQDAWESGSATIAPVIAKRFSSGKPAVICSHRPLIPDILREVLLQAGAAAGTYPPHASTLPTGGFAVVHISRSARGAEIVAVETHAPA